MSNYEFYDVCIKGVEVSDLEDSVVLKIDALADDTIPTDSIFLKRKDIALIAAYAGLDVYPSESKVEYK